MLHKKSHLFYYLLSAIFLIGCTKSTIISSTKSTPVVQFVKTFGGSSNDAARSVIATDDGGYVVLGFSQSNDGDIIDNSIAQYDYWLLKFDANDELIWQKTYGGTKDDRGEKIIQTDDGGYAMIGFSRSSDEDVTSNAGFQDIWVVKIDNIGAISWQKSIGFAGADQGFSILQTQDGGYFLSGVLDVTASNGLGNKSSKHAGGDYWGLKLDPNGNTEWRNYFGGSNTETCYDAIETNDGFILIGSSDSKDIDINSNKGSYDYWVVKIDKQGNLLWEKSLGGQEIETTYVIKNTNDGNFILAGETRSNDQDISVQNGAADVWIVKMNPKGSILWEKNYGGTSFDAARSITPTQDNGFVIVGSSRSIDIDVVENKGQNDVWIIKIDANGKLIWQKSIGGSEIDFAYGVAQLSNGSIITVGDSSSSNNDIIENKGFTDTLIIKIDEE